MKTILHKILRGILILAGFFVLLCIMIFMWHKFGWRKYLDKQEIITITQQINDSKKLPDQFYEIYDKIYPGQRHTSYTKTYIFSGFMFMIYSDLPERYDSPIRYLGRMTYIINTKNKRIRNKKTLPIYLSFALEKYSSPEKCFDFYINNFDFLHNSIGLDNASMTYFNKPIDELTDKEIIGLIVLIDNPSLFNPRRHPDRFKNKVNELYKKYKASA